MNQRILFSPLGGTDPISNKNLKDGSMLHICRVYKPSKVILYMSAEILDSHQKDNRYFYCLDKLEQQLNIVFERELIKRPSLDNVHDFNFFYDEFGSIVENIYEQMDESDTLLINVSSGTPAMKSGLLVLQALREFPCKMIQVTTPEKKMNEHTHKGFDVKIAWELDEDNKEDFENRCEEIQCPSLSKIKKEELMKKHIDVYDYAAAVSIADTMPAQSTAAYYNLLQIAKNRLLLNFKVTDSLLKEETYNPFPIQTPNKRICFEYALNIQAKLKREEYTDFIRALTPLIIDLLEMALKQQCDIDINHYCITTKRGRRWNEKKLASTKILSILDDYFRHAAKRCFKADSPPSSLHLSILIQNLTENPELADLAKNLRNVEEKIRNMAAHEIVSITANTIVEKTGFTGEQIMDKIKRIFTYTDINPGQNAWDSYDNMNRELINRISPLNAL